MGGWLSAVGSALGSSGMSIVNDFSGGWALNSSKESLNKNITKTNLKYQKQYDLWTQAQDKAYEKWYQNYIYDLQNNEYYDLAKKYAENTASWAVKGLKDAGLNPILAAIDGNLSSNLGNAHPASSSGTHSGKSIHGASVSTGGVHSANLAAFSQIRNSAKQMDINEAQSKADLEVKDAQADNLRADAASKSMGNSEWGKNLASVGMLLDSVGLKKPLKELASKATDWLIEQLGTKSESNSGKGLSRSEMLEDRAPDMYDALRSLLESGRRADRASLDRELDRLSREWKKRDKFKNPLILVR